MKYIIKGLKIICLLFLFNNANSQGIIINEISNGTGGTKEFIEFLVIGNSNNLNSQVNLTNWIFDDNNGDFDSPIGSGVASGHYKFKSTFPLVNPGDLIVIYNSNDVNVNLPPDDLYDSNVDGVYVIPISSVLLEKCTSSPSSTGSSLYTPCNYTSSNIQTWTQIGLRNGGDAIQVRDPSYMFYHGFSYGDVKNNYPNFPSCFGGGSSFRVKKGNGAGRNYYLDCGDWTEMSNYKKGSASGDTPGLPNNFNNNLLINNIRLGIFNYTDLLDVGNCEDVILDIGLIDFSLLKYSTHIKIEYQLNDNIKNVYYQLERSSDGIEFEFMDNGSSSQYIDNNPLMHNYYRIKYYTRGIIKYSDVKYMHFEYVNILYPNPITNILNLKIEGFFQIFSINGNLIKSTNQQTIDLGDIQPGTYILKIITNGITIHKTIIKN